MSIKKAKLAKGMLFIAFAFLILLLSLACYVYLSERTMELADALQQLSLSPNKDSKEQTVLRQESTYLNILLQVCSLFFTAAFATIFLDLFKAYSLNNLFNDIKKGSFYNSFGIELPDSLQEAIELQLYKKKIYRGSFSVKYNFHDIEGDNEQLSLVTIAEYTLKNASSSPQPYEIVREVERSNDGVSKSIHFLINGVEVIPKESEGRNSSHVRYSHQIIINVNEEIVVKTYSESIKKNHDNDALYGLILSESMQVEVSFTSKDTYNCRFFSLCDNQGYDDGEHQTPTSQGHMSIYRWQCNKPLLKYQGVKVEWEKC